MGRRTVDSIKEVCENSFLLEEQKTCAKQTNLKLKYKQYYYFKN